MKLLLDENLSPRLVRELSEFYPGSTHLRDLGKLGAVDEEVWALAAAQDFVIVTKDSDFQQRSYLRGHPPKVVWIRLGNRPTAAVERILREHHRQLLVFDADPDAALLVLD